MLEGSSEFRKKAEYEIGEVVAGRFRIMEELGRGGCGVVYKVAAMKVELRRPGYADTLAAEINILSKLQGSKYFCQLFTYGRISKDINIIIMSLAGPSISWLRRHRPQHRFTISTGLRIGYQCLNAIEELHNIGFIHRDIKASNFASGYYTCESREIRLLDFGFARCYLKEDKNGNLRIKKQRKKANFVGTDRYSSPNADLSKDQGRRDDCWSWLFMLTELLYGKLPWKNTNKHGKNLYKSKKSAFPNLFKNGPLELYEILNHLLELKYESRPNYNFIKQILINVCKKYKINFNDPYDWEDNKSVHDMSFDRSISISTPRMALTESSAEQNQAQNAK